jgi:hypothetical protein
LIASLVPALYYGERRILVEGEVCPELLAGCEVVISLFNYWFYGCKPRSLSIEAMPRLRAEPLPDNRAAGLFFSGGIDAYATLCRNRRYFDRCHPSYFRHGILVFGFELDDEQAFEWVSATMRVAADAFDLRLTPVFTNIYCNYRAEDRLQGHKFWMTQYQGSAFAAVAHVIAYLVNSMSLASHANFANLCPIATHPLYEPNFSNHAVRICHDGVHMSRLDKVKLVAQSETAFKYLRVCNRVRRYSLRFINCGYCEKCVRTMLELYVVGASESMTIFERNELDAQKLRRYLSVSDPMGYATYAELVAPLIIMERNDLAKAVVGAMRNYRWRQYLSWTLPLKSKTTPVLRSLWRSST